MSKKCDQHTSAICEETQTKLEKSFWQRLNFVEMIKMRYHLFICKNCSAYEKDSKIIHQLLCKLKSTDTIEKLSPEEKQKLKSKIG